MIYNQEQMIYLFDENSMEKGGKLKTKEKYIIDKSSTFKYISVNNSIYRLHLHIIIPNDLKTKKKIHSKISKKDKSKNKLSIEQF